MTDISTFNYYETYQQPLLIVLPGEADQQKTLVQLIAMCSPYKNPLTHQSINWVNSSMELLGIDTARQISNEITYSPLDEQVRIFVLLGFEQATIEAQNALLKLLESSANQTQFWLVTQNLNRVLPTIQSRCELVTVPKARVVLKENSEVLPAQIFLQLQQASIPECIELAGKYSDRTAALNLVTSLLNWLTQQTEFIPSASQLQTLQTAFARLEQNANVKLALESAFFGLSGAKDHF